MKILEQIEELENEYYGKEEDDFEGGVFEDNYECAEWARDNVDSLFSMVRNLVADLREKSSQLSEAESLLYDARSLLNDIHGYDTDTYRAIGVFLYGEEEDEEYDDDEDYVVIECIECLEDKEVEKGTWALDKGMCEKCYCKYQDGK